MTSTTSQTVEPKTPRYKAGPGRPRKRPPVTYEDLLARIDTERERLDACQQAVVEAHTLGASYRRGELTNTQVWAALYELREANPEVPQWMIGEAAGFAPVSMKAAFRRVQELTAV